MYAAIVDLSLVHVGEHEGPSLGCGSASTLGRRKGDLEKVHYGRADDREVGRAWEVLHQHGGCAPAVHKAPLLNCLRDRHVAGPAVAAGEGVAALIRRLNTIKGKPKFSWSGVRTMPASGRPWISGGV